MRKLTRLKFSRPKGWSIFAKCLLLSAIIAIVLASALTYANHRLTIRIATEGVRVLAAANSASAALSITGPVKFGNAEVAQAEIDKMIAHSNNLVLGTLVVRAHGPTLVQSEGMDPALDANLRDMAQAAQERAAVVTDGNGLYMAIPIFFGAEQEIVGVFAAAWTAAPILTDVQQAKLVNTLAGAGLLLAMLGLMFLTMNRILRKPIRRLDAAVMAVAGGDYDFDVRDTERQDEVGNLARNLSVMKVSLSEGRARQQAEVKKQQQESEVMGILRAALKSLASGNLNARITSDLPADYKQLSVDFNETATSFHDAMEAVVARADRIRAESIQIGTHSENLSVRTESQAATLEQTAAALDQITSSVQAAADGAREIEKIVTDARSEAAASDVVVQDTVRAMAEIEKSSGRISAIISVIEDITFQTNLLALNAGVEAARAGEAGRGFAVVASEVRALAGRSSEAAREIKGLIGGSAEHVAHGVSLVDKAGAALTAIAERVTHIASLVGTIASGAAEQSLALGEINIGVGQLDRVTQQNAGMVEEAHVASQELRQEADALADLVSGFRLSPPPARKAGATPKRAAA